MATALEETNGEMLGAPRRVFDVKKNNTMSQADFANLALQAQRSMLNRNKEQQVTSEIATPIDSTITNNPVVSVGALAQGEILAPATPNTAPIALPVSTLESQNQSVKMHSGQVLEPLTPEVFKPTETLSKSKVNYQLDEDSSAVSGDLPPNVLNQKPQIAGKSDKSSQKVAKLSTGTSERVFPVTIFSLFLSPLIGFGVFIRTLFTSQKALQNAFTDEDREKYTVRELDYSVVKKIEKENKKKGVETSAEHIVAAQKAATTEVNPLEINAASIAEQSLNNSEQLEVISASISSDTVTDTAAVTAPSTLTNQQSPSTIQEATPSKSFASVVLPIENPELNPTFAAYQAPMQPATLSVSQPKPTPAQPFAAQQTYLPPISQQLNIESQGAIPSQPNLTDQQSISQYSSDYQAYLNFKNFQQQTQAVNAQNITQPSQYSLSQTPPQTPPQNHLAQNQSYNPTQNMAFTQPSSQYVKQSFPPQSMAPEPINGFQQPRTLPFPVQQMTSTQPIDNFPQNSQYNAYSAPDMSSNPGVNAVQLANIPAQGPSFAIPIPNTVNQSNLPAQNQSIDDTLHGHNNIAGTVINSSYQGNRPSATPLEQMMSGVGTLSKNTRPLVRKNKQPSTADLFADLDSIMSEINSSGDNINNSVNKMANDALNSIDRTFESDDHNLAKKFNRQLYSGTIPSSTLGGVNG